MPSVPPEGVYAACSQFLPMVDGAYLDCICDDLALLLASRRVTNLLAVFGQDWRFDIVEEAGNLPRPALPPADTDELVAQRTGWRPRWQQATSPERDARDWCAELGAGNPVLVVGDAYHLPWLPYAGHEHMAHGFVVDGLSWDDGVLLAHIADPYDNVTEWGPAQPLTVRTEVTSLAPGLEDGRWAVLAPAGLAPAGQARHADPGQRVAANAAAIAQAAAGGAYQRFIDAHEEPGVDQARSLALATWLLARNRALHARWLASLPASQLPDSLAERFESEISEAWRRAMEMCYIAMRRQLDGRAAPPAAIRSVRQAAAAEQSLAASVLARGGDPLEPPAVLAPARLARGEPADAHE